MNLYIMTRGRVGKLLTPKSIPSLWRSRTFIVCPYPEIEQHKEDWPELQVMCAPSTVTNYSQKFQYLMGWIHNHGGKGVIMDDDLWWDRRGEAKNGKSPLEKLDSIEELNAAWVEVGMNLDHVPLVGFHPRMMGHLAPVHHRDVGKMITVQGINTALFPMKGRLPKLDHDPILADVHLVCWMLAHGRPNRLLTDWVVNWGPSQAPGGCDYRTSEMQHDACLRIADMYGPYAKAVTKTPKTVKWLGDSRTDLRVQWKSLFKARPLARE